MNSKFGKPRMMFSRQTKGRSGLADGGASSKATVQSRDRKSRVDTCGRKAHCGTALLQEATDTITWTYRNPSLFPINASACFLSHNLPLSAWMIFGDVSVDCRRLPRISGSRLVWATIRTPQHSIEPLAHPSTIAGQSAFPRYQTPHLPD
jgi:hypothetical protein